MKKFLKALLIILIFLIVAAGIAFLTIKMKWHWSLGAAIFAGIVGVWLGVVFFKRYRRRKKEKQFIQKVVEIDEAVIKKASPHVRQELKELQRKWKEAIEILRTSNIRRGFKNPIYALPWYIIIGESGSGKTTAIRNARSNAPLTDITRTATLSATQNCDWWFLENAIILDTAGRYTIPTNEAIDREEWEELLLLLAKYRKKEPLNGIIATISAEKLLNADPMTLRADGQSIRNRIDQITRTSGAKIPVFIMITKMDKVYGFTDTFISFPESITKQVAGYYNNYDDVIWESVLERFFYECSNNLSKIRLNAVKKASAEVLVFKEEFLSLKKSLHEFVKSVFEENPYQETPLLRGIYFSSARQEGEAISQFLSIDSKPATSKHTHTEERGYFLEDFFKIVLPQERYTFSPAYEYLKWRRYTKNAGFLALLFIFLSLSGLLTASYFHNVSVLNDFDFKKPPVLTHNLSTDLLLLEKFRLEIVELEGNNKKWLIPEFGLDSSKRLEEKAKEFYVNLYKQFVLEEFNRKLQVNVAKINKDTDSDTVAVYMEYLGSHIAMLKDFLDKGKIVRDSQDYKNMKRATANLMAFMFSDVPTPVAQLTADIHIAYIEWNKDVFENKRDLEVAELYFHDILRKHRDLKWFVRQSFFDFYDIPLSSFWLKVPNQSDSVVLQGEHTKEGEEKIKKFISYLERVGLKDDKYIRDFWEWYRIEYINDWKNFLASFTKGENLLKTHDEKKLMALTMTTEQNPYYLVLKRAAQELTPDEYLKEIPQWAQLVVELDETKKLVKESSAEKKPLEVKIQEEKEKIVERFLKITKKSKDDLEKRINTGNALIDMEKAISQLSSVIMKENAYIMLTDSKSPINDAILKYYILRNSFQSDPESEIVWRLVAGPIKYLINYSINVAACIIQSKWEENVIAKAENVSAEQLPQALFDKKEGLIPQFLDTLKAFLTSSKFGYNPVKLFSNTYFETSIPFTSEFLKFLNLGQITPVTYKKDYIINFETIPVDVNNDASVKPEGVILTVECSDEQIKIENYNFYKKMSVRWSPERCGKTVLKILFPDFSLSKSYEGALGFAKFLSDFRTGSHTFKPVDFPEMKENLDKFNIKEIKVKYRIDNPAPVIELLKGIKLITIPDRITDCRNGTR